MAHQLFSGRINIWTYCAGVALFCVTAFSQIIILAEFFQFLIQFENGHLISEVMFVLYNIILIGYYFSIQVRRLHDVGIGEWYRGRLVFYDGEMKENKCGKPPKPGIDLMALVCLPSSRG